MRDNYLFNLYTFGKTTSYLTAMNNLKKICISKLKDKYVIKVIDLKENIQIAEDEEIWATPTVERVSPEPAVRIVGDLSDSDAVVHTLILYKG